MLVIAEGLPPPGTEPLRTLGQREVLLAGAAGPGALARWLDVLDADRGRLIGPPDLWAGKPLAATGAGPVIASDVTAHFQVARRKPGADAGARARVRDAVLGLGAAVPLRLHEVVVRAITLGSLDTAAIGRQHADLVIRPDVRTVGMVAFDQLAQLREAGRRSARAALEGEPALTGWLTRS